MGQTPEFVFTLYVHGHHPAPHHFSSLQDTAMTSLLGPLV